VITAIANSPYSEDYSFIQNTSQVPRHSYMSLSKFLTGNDNSSAFPDLVTASAGTGNPDQEGIEISYVSEEAAELGFTDASDESPASESGLVKILCRVKQVAIDGSEDKLVRDMDARVRWLIDYKARAKRDDLDPALDPAGIDNTLDPDQGVTCYWLKFLTPSHVHERVSLYRVGFDTIMTP